jgi:hypothetical protein
MYSDSDTACAVGCPIRRSRDQRLLASPPGLSQRATSFIASQCQGIHQMPLVTRLSTAPNGKDQTASLQLILSPMRQTLLKTHVGHVPAPRPPNLAACRQVCRTCPPRSRHILASSPIQSAKRNGNVITSVANRNFIPSSDRRAPSPLPTRNGGGERDRTDDLLLAKQALSQLSYTPGSGRHFCHQMVGQGGFEPPTSRLSSARSNQLSY